jgi:hypothetical protein
VTGWAWFIHSLEGEDAMKWADYVITAVQYNADHTRIVAYEVWDDGETLMNCRLVPWAAVARSLLDGKTFVTATKGTDGKFYRGASLELVVKTVEDRVARDNLNHLPAVA